MPFILSTHFALIFVIQQQIGKIAYLSLVILIVPRLHMQHIMNESFIIMHTIFKGGHSDVPET